MSFGNSRRATHAFHLVQVTVRFPAADHATVLIGRVDYYYSVVVVVDVVASHYKDVRNRFAAAERS